MRSYRPSSRAMAVSGALAIVLLVAGTSGAVAGRLITSHDIKDGTIRTQDLRDDSITNAKIAPGSVTWEKSLSAATKAQIAALLGSGTPGPAGEPGPVGPSGSPGAPGPSGAPGAGSLVAQDYYGFNGYSATDPDTETSQLLSSSGHTIQLAPGNYLVSVDGVFLGLDGVAPLIFAGPTDLESGTLNADLFLNACVAESYFPTCSVTFPVSVPPGDTLDLPVIVPSNDVSACAGGSCDPLALARVAVYQMGGDYPSSATAPALPTGSPSGCAPPLNRALKQLTHPNAARRNC